MSEKDSKKKSNLKPTFEPVFGDSWKNLPLVLKKRYSNRLFFRIYYLDKLFGSEI